MTAEHLYISLRLLIVIHSVDLGHHWSGRSFLCTTPGYEVLNVAGDMDGSQAGAAAAANSSSDFVRGLEPFRQDIDHVLMHRRCGNCTSMMRN